jgi:DNA invertase Pin-like site-specific DNA recombinase
MAVYGYVRVSTIQQATEGESLETQKRQVISYAESRGLTLGCENVFIEKGVSGGDEFNSRPEGSKLMSILNYGDVLIFPKLDRGFRNTRDALNTLHSLKEIGVSVHSIDLGGDVTGNGVGAIIFTILSAFATFEKERIASRIKEVKQRRKAEGYFVGGRRAFGFDVINGKKVPNKKEQDLLKQMKAMKGRGKTLKSIHCWLTNDKNVVLAYSSMREALLRSIN